MPPTITAAQTVMTAFSFDQVLFEAVSAFATVGLSTGITALPALRVPLRALPRWRRTAACRRTRRRTGARGVPAG